MTSLVINPYSVGAVVAVAPGTITLGTPDGLGIPFTMPSLPAGAGSLILQSSVDNSTWRDAYTGLAGGETGTFQKAGAGDDPTGHQSELIYFRAKNTIGGLTGSSTNATTVALPAVPGAVTSYEEVDEAFTLRFGMPSMPARATDMLLFVSLTNGEAPPTSYLGGTSSGGVTLEFTDLYPSGFGVLYYGLKSVNIYGESALGSTLNADVVQTPGVIISAGDPDANGIPFQCPGLPTGAGSFEVQSSSDESTWYGTNFYGLEGGHSDYYNQGPHAGSATGHPNTLIYLRVANANGGKVSASFSATTVGLPSAPTANATKTAGFISCEECDPQEFGYELTLPALYPDDGTFTRYRIYTDAEGDGGDQQEPVTDRGLFDPEQVCNTNGVDWGGGCLAGRSVTCKLAGWNIYGETLQIWDLTELGTT